MCGLIAIYDPQQRLALPNIAAIKARLHHRGPDGFCYLHRPHLFMGHSRLQVESADSDRQPIQSADGDISLIVNGELYPYKQLKKQLERRGYCFQTQSDSELVLALYQLYGDKFVNYLRGEFSCILWDAKRQLLLAVRDRFGIKPLHYAEYQGRWYFASEAKGLIAAGFPAQWSKQGLVQSFSHQYLKPGVTLFYGIKQIPPGSCLRVTKGKGVLEPYFSLAYGEFDAADLPIKLAIEKVKTDFIESVQLRMPSRKPCAFSLSGGLDSTAVVSVASRFLDAAPHCYTVSFDHPGYDEYGLVDNFASGKPIHLHKVKVTSDEVIKYIDQAAYFSEGLASNGQYVAKYLLNRAIAEDGYRVVMSGEGADEAFMGYAHLHHDYLNHQLNHQLNHSLDHPLEQVENDKNATALAIDSLLASNSLQAGLMLAGKGSLAIDEYIPSFLQAKFQFCQRFTPLFRGELLTGETQLAMQKSLLKAMDVSLSKPLRSNKLWVEMVLANYILKTLGDGMEMASSVEGRLPFLDHKLFCYAANLPLQYKLSAHGTKKIFRHALKGIVSEKVRTRNKHPFIAPPLASSLSARGFDLIMEKFSRKSFQENPVFNPKAVLHWVKQWRAQTGSRAAELDPVLMMLLSFAALQEQFQMLSLR